MMNKFARLSARLREVEGLQGEHVFVLHFADRTSVSKDVRRPLDLFLAVCELTCYGIKHGAFPDLAVEKFQCLTEKRLRIIRLMGASTRIETDDRFFEVIWAHAVHA